MRIWLIMKSLKLSSLVLKFILIFLLFLLLIFYREHNSMSHTKFVCVFFVFSFFEVMDLIGGGGRRWNEDWRPEPKLQDWGNKKEDTDKKKMKTLKATRVEDTRVTTLPESLKWACSNSGLADFKTQVDHIIRYGMLRGAHVCIKKKKKKGLIN
jgi:hypothetical protein